MKTTRKILSYDDSRNILKPPL